MSHPPQVLHNWAVGATPRPKPNFQQEDFDEHLSENTHFRDEISIVMLPSLPWNGKDLFLDWVRTTDAPLWALDTKMARTPKTAYALLVFMMTLFTGGERICGYSSVRRVIGDLAEYPLRSIGIVARMCVPWVKVHQNWMKRALPNSPVPHRHALEYAWSEWVKEAMTPTEEIEQNGIRANSVDFGVFLRQREAAAGGKPISTSTLGLKNPENIVTITWIAKPSVEDMVELARTAVAVKFLPRRIWPATTPAVFGQCPFTDRLIAPGDEYTLAVWHRTNGPPCMTPLAHKPEPPQPKNQSSIHAMDVESDSESNSEFVRGSSESSEEVESSDSGSECSIMDMERMPVHITMTEDTEVLAYSTLLEAGQSLEDADKTEYASQSDPTPSDHAFWVVLQNSVAAVAIERVLKEGPCQTPIDDRMGIFSKFKLAHTPIAFEEFKTLVQNRSPDLRTAWHRLAVLARLLIVRRESVNSNIIFFPDDTENSAGNHTTTFGLPLAMMRVPWSMLRAIPHRQMPWPLLCLWAESIQETDINFLSQANTVEELVKMIKIDKNLHSLVCATMRLAPAPINSFDTRTELARFL